MPFRNSAIVAALVQTATAGNRIEIDGTNPDRGEIRFYTGVAGEEPGTLTALYDPILAPFPALFMQAGQLDPSAGDPNPAALVLTGSNAAGTQPRVATLWADRAKVAETKVSTGGLAYSDGDIPAGIPDVLQPPYVGAGSVGILKMKFGSRFCPGAGSYPVSFLVPFYQSVWAVLVTPDTFVTVAPNPTTLAGFTLNTSGPTTAQWIALGY